jgi:hypothetical protein
LPAPITESAPALVPEIVPEPAPTTDQQILDLIAENPAITDVAAVEPPPGAYLPDTVPAETITIEPAPVAEGYSTSMPDESAAETERLARREQEILDLIAENPTTTVAEKVGDELATPDQTPVIVPPVSEVIPASVEIASTPVAELYDSTMQDQSQAETDRLIRQNQEILDLITPTTDIPAANPMSRDPAQLAAEAAEVPAVDEIPSTDTGLIDTSPVSDADQEILDLISEELAADTTTEEEAAAPDGTERGAYLPDSGTDTTTTTTRPDIFTTTYLSPKKRTTSSTSALGSALGTTGLTASRGAGEIEAPSTGKARKKVWNEESLKLKDALGV